VLALLSDASEAVSAWNAGARGLLLRTASAETIASVAATLAEGLVVIDPLFAAQLFPARDQPPTQPIEELTPRELQVLRLIAEGQSNKEIARALGISEHTVKFHVNAILGKLNVQSRTEAVVHATRLGLILL
jgi:DNA-binding NarL/FixJ family response regulator